MRVVERLDRAERQRAALQAARKAIALAAVVMPPARRTAARYCASTVVGRVRALEVRRGSARLARQWCRRKQSLDACATRRPRSLADAMHRGADVDRRHGRHAARPGLQEGVGHALVDRGVDQHARAVEPGSTCGERQEALELDVRQRRGLRRGCARRSAARPPAAGRRSSRSAAAAGAAPARAAARAACSRCTRAAPTARRSRPRRRALRGRQLVAARDHDGVAAVVSPGRLTRWASFCATMRVDAAQAAAVEPAVARVADLAAGVGHEVLVGGAGVDRALAVAAAELGEHADPHRRPSGSSRCRRRPRAARATSRSGADAGSAAPARRRRARNVLCTVTPSTSARSRLAVSRGRSSTRGGRRARAGARGSPAAPRRRRRPGCAGRARAPARRAARRSRRAASCRARTPVAGRSRCNARAHHPGAAHLARRPAARACRTSCRSPSRGSTNSGCGPQAAAGHAGEQEGDQRRARRPGRSRASRG